MNSPTSLIRLEEPTDVLWSEFMQGGKCFPVKRFILSSSREKEGRSPPICEKEKGRIFHTL